MKRLLTTILALCFFTVGFTQTTFWTSYSFEVKSGMEQNFVQAMDQFMSTEAGKAMPAMSLSAKVFAGSESEFTHRITFLTTDRAAFGKMYSGILQQTADFQLLGAQMDASSNSTGSYLGKSLFSVGNTNGNFSNVLTLNLKDAGKYLEAFKKLGDAMNTMWEGEIGISLHQVLSGNENNVTHLAVISSPDFEKMLDFSDKLYSTPAFAEFNSVAKDIRKVVANSTTVTLKRYNVPE